MKTYATIPDSQPAWPVNIISTFIKDPPPTNSEPGIPTLITDLHAAQSKPLRKVCIL